MRKRINKNNSIVESNSIKDTFFVICNGPSLRGFDFNAIKGYESIAMNAAYRMFEKIDFWPTYFCCADLRVGMYHADEYTRLMQERNSIFLLRSNAFHKIQNSNKLSVEDISKLYEINCNYGNAPYSINATSRKFNAPEPGCTGQLAATFAMTLGFKKIVLLGADCNYVERVPGSREVSPGRLVIADDSADNPNYWFNDYQIKGDEYNVPGGMIYHMNGWKKLSELAGKANTKIINCSTISKIPFFEKIKFEDLEL
jgi:hypothetical protein